MEHMPLEVTYNSEELRKLADDIAKCGISALLAGERLEKKKRDQDATIIRRDCVYAAAALRWCAENMAPDANLTDAAAQAR